MSQSSPVELLESRLLLSKIVNFDDYFPGSFYSASYFGYGRDSTDQVQNIRHKNGRTTFQILTTYQNGESSRVWFQVDQDAIRSPKVVERNKRGEVKSTITFDPPVLFAPRQMETGRDYTDTTTLVLVEGGKRYRGTADITVRSPGFRGGLLWPSGFRGSQRHHEQFFTAR